MYVDFISMLQRFISTLISCFEFHMNATQLLSFDFITAMPGTRDARFGLKLDRIGTKWAYLELFKISCLFILTHISILISPILVAFGAYVAQWEDSFDNPACYSAVLR